MGIELAVPRGSVYCSGMIDCSSWGTRYTVTVSTTVPPLLWVSVLLYLYTVLTELTVPCGSVYCLGTIDCTLWEIPYTITVSTTVPPLLWVSVLLYLCKPYLQLTEDYLLVATSLLYEMSNIVICRLLCFKFNNIPGEANLDSPDSPMADDDLRTDPTSTGKTLWTMTGSADPEGTLCTAGRARRAPAAPPAWRRECRRRAAPQPALSEMLAVAALLAPPCPQFTIQLKN